MSPEQNSIVQEVVADQVNANLTTVSITIEGEDGTYPSTLADFSEELSEYRFQEAEVSRLMEDGCREVSLAFDGSQRIVARW